MVDPRNPSTIRDLYDAVEASRYKMGRHREARLDLVRQYCGWWYGDNQIGDKVPVNFIALAAGILARQLIANFPQTLITARSNRFAPAAANLELALPKLYEEIDLREELETWVYEALFGLGVMKLGVEHADFNPGGQPYVSAIDYDDLILDMSAKSVREGQYIGDKYRVPLDWARGNEQFDPLVRQRLRATDRKNYTEEGEEKAQAIGEGETYRDDEELEPHVDLMDLYLRDADAIVTLPVEREGGVYQPLGLVRNQFGFDPYIELYFKRVPGNIMPLPPLAVWKDLHDLGNVLFRKLGRQAEAQKTVGVVQKRNADDGRRVMEAGDHDVVTADTENPINLNVFPGADPNTMGMFLQTKELVNWMSGNIEVMGGLSPQADTLGQEQLLAENSGSQIAEMSERVVAATQKVCKGLAHLLWTDPTRVWRLNRELPNSGISIDTIFTPDDRQLPISTFDIKVDPYSLRPTSPGQRLQGIITLMSRLVFPLLPQLQQQGVQVDMRELMKQLVRLSNIHELGNILIFAPPEAAAEGEQAQQGAAQSPNTTRTYERINRPGATRQGNDGTLARMMAAQGQRTGVQPAEAAAIGRR